MDKDGTGGIEGRLALLGLALPAPPTPAGNYVPWVRAGNLLFVGGNIGRLDGASLIHTGRLGAEVSVAQGYEMARRCGLNHLAVIKAALGALDRVARVVKVTGWISVAPGFFDMPDVLNGESDLLVELWGERGRHTRAAIGVAALSRNAPVETEIVVQVASETGGRTRMTIMTAPRQPRACATRPPSRVLFEVGRGSQCSPGLEQRLRRDEVGGVESFLKHS